MRKKSQIALDRHPTLGFAYDCGGPALQRKRGRRHRAALLPPLFTRLRSGRQLQHKSDGAYLQAFPAEGKGSAFEKGGHLNRNALKISGE
jgi:hypothetical protein